MLLQATLIVDLLAMAITLWMVFYLFARGFPSQITLRGVGVMLMLSLFFFGAYNNTLHFMPGTISWRASFLVMGMAIWYSLAVRLTARQDDRRYRLVGTGLYILAGISIFLLLQPNSFVDEEANVLYISQMTIGPVSVVIGVYQIAVISSILFLMVSDQRARQTATGRYFLIASIFPSLSAVYSVLALVIPTQWPHLIPDLLIFLGVFILGISVARHQTLTERRTTLQDFPITSITVLALAAVYAYAARAMGLPAELTAAVVSFAIVTHAVYDLAREFLDRLRARRDGDFRRELRSLENQNAGQDTFLRRLQEGLLLLCRTLHAPGGFVAIRQSDQFIVTATSSSLAVGTELAETLVACDELSHPSDARLSSLAWIAPSFEGQTQVAVVALGKSTDRTDYSKGDLELLAEVADQIGTLVSLNNFQPVRGEKLRELVADSQAQKSDARSVASEMMEAMNTNTASEIIKNVEEALRHLPDTIALGKSTLADTLGVAGASQVERGKELQRILSEAIEFLRPAEKRPPEPLPRAWYNHAVLHDAYVEGVPNREIMARLYVSEGTFNRTRRNAIRGLARLLLEKAK